MECPNCKDGDAEQFEEDGREVLECPACGTFEILPDGGMTPCEREKLVQKITDASSSDEQPEPTPEPTPEPEPISEPNENATATLQEAAPGQQGPAPGPSPTVPAPPATESEPVTPADESDEDPDQLTFGVSFEDEVEAVPTVLDDDEE